MQWTADPHADDTVAAAIGSLAGQERLDRIDELNAVIRTWHDNSGVAAWRPTPSQPAHAVAAVLQAYVTAAHPLPDWAEPERIVRAEATFMDYGALSVTMLFCASLPECYVIPDLATVLHSTGQLEDRAQHRIRTT